VPLFALFPGFILLRGYRSLRYPRSQQRGARYRLLGSDVSIGANSSGGRLEDDAGVAGVNPDRCPWRWSSRPGSAVARIRTPARDRCGKHAAACFLRRPKRDSSQPACCFPQRRRSARNHLELLELHPLAETIADAPLALNATVLQRMHPALRALSDTMNREAFARSPSVALIRQLVGFAPVTRRYLSGWLARTGVSVKILGLRTAAFRRHDESRSSPNYDSPYSPADSALPLRDPRFSYCSTFHSFRELHSQTFPREEKRDVYEASIKLTR